MSAREVSRSMEICQSRKSESAPEYDGKRDLNREFTSKPILLLASLTHSAISSFSSGSAGVKPSGVSSRVSLASFRFDELVMVMEDESEEQGVEADSFRAGAGVAAAQVRLDDGCWRLRSLVTSSSAGSLSLSMMITAPVCEGGRAVERSRNEIVSGGVRRASEIRDDTNLE